MLEQLLTDILNLILRLLSRRDLATLARVNRWTRSKYSQWKAIEFKSRIARISSELEQLDISSPIVSFIRFFDILLRYQSLDLRIGYKPRVNLMMDINSFIEATRQQLKLPDFLESQNRYPNVFEAHFRTISHLDMNIFPLLVAHLPQQPLFISQLESLGPVYFLIKLNWFYQLGLENKLLPKWRQLYQNRLNGKFDFERSDNQPINVKGMFSHFHSAQHLSAFSHLTFIKPYFPGEYYAQLPKLGLGPNFYRRLMMDELDQPYSPYFQSQAEVYAYYRPLVGKDFVWRYTNYQISGWETVVHQPSCLDINPSYLILKKSRKIHIFYPKAAEEIVIYHFNWLPIDQVRKELAIKGNFDSVVLPLAKPGKLSLQRRTIR